MHARQHRVPLLRWLFALVAVLALLAVGCATDPEEVTAPDEDADDPAGEEVDDPGAEEPDQDTDDADAPDADGDAGEPTPADRERTLVIAIPNDVETLDPPFGAHTMTNLTLKNIYDQFFQYTTGEEDDGFHYADLVNLEGRAVESWEYSEDHRTVTLHIRQGVVFPHTGNEMTADDFLYKFERAFGIQAGTQWVFNTIGIFGMDQIEQVDDHTIQITLEEPSPLFEQLLRDQVTGIEDGQEIQDHATDDDEWATQWLARNHAGAGEYLVEEWASGEQMVLRANPEYWDEEPYFTEVILRVVPEAANRVLLLQQGEVDIALELGIRDYETLEASDGVKVVSVPERLMLFMGMNLDVEPFDDPLVRQALSYAVPYDQIVDGVLRGRATHATGPISPQSFWYDEYDLGSVDAFEHDPDAARELLADAGHDDGFSFTLAIPSGIPYVEETATVLRDAFGDIGVDMSIDIQSGAVFAEQGTQQQHEAFIRSWASDYVDDPYYNFFLWWETDTVLNWFNYSNSTVDEVIDQTRYMVDDEQRAPLVREGVGHIVQDAPALWLASGNFDLAMREDIQGYVHHPDQLLWFYTLYRDE